MLDVELLVSLAVNWLRTTISLVYPLLSEEKRTDKVATNPRRHDNAHEVHLLVVEKVDATYMLEVLKIVFVHAGYGMMNTLVSCIPVCRLQESTK